MKHKKRSPAFPLIPNDGEYCLVDDKKKRKYESEVDALFAAPVPALQQYVCEYCGYWHNGNSNLSNLGSLSNKKPPQEGGFY